MRVTYKYGIGGLRGRADGMVFCYNRYLGRPYTRKMVYPKITEKNVSFGNVTANIFRINPSQGYRDDMYYYMARYRNLNEANMSLITWSNFYLKLMYDMAKADNTIDLRTLTREEIYSRDLPCISVKKAVEAGLLPVVYDYRSFTHEL